MGTHPKNTHPKNIRVALEGRMVSLKYLIVAAAMPLAVVEAAAAGWCRGGYCGIANCPPCEGNPHLMKFCTFEDCGAPGCPSCTDALPFFCNIDHCGTPNCPPCSSFKGLEADLSWCRGGFCGIANCPPCDVLNTTS